jgi:hypothetical protein
MMSVTDLDKNVEEMLGTGVEGLLEATMRR